jgi:hypothetical protein
MICILWKVTDSFYKIERMIPSKEGEDCAVVVPEDWYIIEAGTVCAGDQMFLPSEVRWIDAMARDVGLDIYNYFCVIRRST